MYYYDRFGWLTSEVIDGRETNITPPSNIPDGHAANWTGITWIVLPYTEPSSDGVQSLPISIQNFLLLFTVQERIALRASTDPIIKEWIIYLYDPRVTEVDLADKNMEVGLLYATSIGILAEGRAERIRQGLRPI